MKITMINTRGWHSYRERVYRNNSHDGNTGGWLNLTLLRTTTELCYSHDFGATIELCYSYDFMIVTWNKD